MINVYYYNIRKEVKMKKLFLAYMLCLLGGSVVAGPLQEGIHFLSCTTNHLDGAGNEMHYVEFADIEDIKLDEGEDDDEYFYVSAQKIGAYCLNKFGFANYEIYSYDNISGQMQKVAKNYIFSYPKEVAIKKGKFDIGKYMCVVKGRIKD